MAWLDFGLGKHRSKVKVTAGRRGSEDIHTDAEASK